VSEIADRLRAAGCVFAEDEARLLTSAAGDPGELMSLVERRIAGEPLEHVLGWAEFCGLRVAVGGGVFVPRRRTEVLVRHAVRLLGRGSIFVDLCTGSGAVAVAVASFAHPGEVHAVDIDATAVACARRNLAGLGEVYCGDLFAALPGRLCGSIDVLTINAPYVPTEQLHLLPRDAREHEPRSALDGGPDGLHVHRRVLAQAPEWLGPGGHVLVEVAAAQAREGRRIAARAGLDPTVHIEPETRTAIVVARRPDDPRSEQE
jgi:release factor glutamine methyltransferase